MITPKNNRKLRNSENEKKEPSDSENTSSRETIQDNDMVATPADNLITVIMLRVSLIFLLDYFINLLSIEAEMALEEWSGADRVDDLIPLF